MEFNFDTGFRATTRKVIKSEKVKKPKNKQKINSCFIKVVNEITLDGNLLIYHKVSR